MSDETEVKTETYRWRDIHAGNEKVAAKHTSRQLDQMTVVQN